MDKLDSCIGSPHWEACENCLNFGENGCRLDDIEIELYCGDFIICLDYKENCDHKWVDARNEVVKSGEVCLKCQAVRSGNS